MHQIKPTDSKIFHHFTDKIRDQFALNAGSRVLPGRVYKFTGWTKLIDRKRTGDVHSLELWMRFKKRGEKAQKKKRLARRTKYSQGWWKFHFRSSTKIVKDKILFKKKVK